MKDRSSTDSKDRGSSGSSSSETSTTRSGSSSSRTSVNVTSEQRTTIRQTIVTGGSSVKRVSRSSLGGVSISVGTSLPREKVTITRLPPRIVEIVPEYRDYSYFVTDDDVIVIVDPDTYEIVYVIEN